MTLPQPAPFTTVAIGGVALQIEQGKSVQRRSIQNSGAILETLEAAAREGLQRASSRIGGGILANLPVDMFCAPTPPAGATESWTCKAPTRLPDSITSGTVNEKKLNYVLLMVAQTKRSQGETRRQWGIVGGFGAAVPAMTTETDTTFAFQVEARLYDVHTGEVAATADAAVTTTGTHGVWVFVPYSVGPSESRYYDAIGRAIGEDLGSRFRFPDEPSR